MIGLELNNVMAHGRYRELTDKPKYAADDYLAIKRRMEELEYERSVVRQSSDEIMRVYRCKPCDSSGWIQLRNGGWRTCMECRNPLGKNKPF